MFPGCKRCTQQYSAVQEVKDPYHLLELEFLSFDLALDVQALLTRISLKLSSASFVPEVQFSQYVPALEKIASLRLLQQVICHSWGILFAPDCLLSQFLNGRLGYHC